MIVHCKMTLPKRKWRKLGMVTGRDKNNTKKNSGDMALGIHHVQVPAVGFFYLGSKKNRGNLAEVHHLFIPFHVCNRPTTEQEVDQRLDHQWEMRFLFGGRKIPGSKGAMKGATESNCKQLLSGSLSW